MAFQHCPFCNAKKISAIGSVAYSHGVLIEHHCNYCGRLFCIMDRRGTQPDEYPQRLSAQVPRSF